MIHRVCKHCGKPECSIESTCDNPNYGLAQCEWVQSQTWFVWKSRSGARPDSEALSPSFLTHLQMHDANEVWHTQDGKSWHIVFNSDRSIKGS